MIWDGALENPTRHWTILQHVHNHCKITKSVSFMLLLDLPVMNLYHKSLLCWSFQRDYDLSKIESWIGESANYMNGQVIRY